MHNNFDYTNTPAGVVLDYRAMDGICSEAAGRPVTLSDSGHALLFPSDRGNFTVALGQGADQEAVQADESGILALPCDTCDPCSDTIVVRVNAEALNAALTDDLGEVTAPEWITRYDWTLHPYKIMGPDYYLDKDDNR